MIREVRGLHAHPPWGLVCFKVDETACSNLTLVLSGAPDSPYSGGEYCAKIYLPNSYPFEAPRIVFVTPSGRFVPDQSICIDGLTNHHAGGWTPINSLETVIVGILSIMSEEVFGLGGIPGADSTAEQIARLPGERLWLTQTSVAFNIRRKLYDGMTFVGIHAGRQSDDDCGTGGIKRPGTPSHGDLDCEPSAKKARA